MAFPSQSTHPRSNVFSLTATRCALLPSWLLAQENAVLSKDFRVCFKNTARRSPARHHLFLATSTTIQHPVTSQRLHVDLLPSTG